MGTGCSFQQIVGLVDTTQRRILDGVRRGAS
jgi:hypothetical protein